MKSGRIILLVVGAWLLSVAASPAFAGQAPCPKHAQLPQAEAAPHVHVSIAIPDSDAQVSRNHSQHSDNFPGGCCCVSLEVGFVRRGDTSSELLNFAETFANPDSVGFLVSTSAPQRHARPALAAQSSPPTTRLARLPILRLSNRLRI